MPHVVEFKSSKNGPSEGFYAGTSRALIRADAARIVIFGDGIQQGITIDPAAHITTVGGPTNGIGMRFNRSGERVGVVQDPAYAKTYASARDAAEAANRLCDAGITAYPALYKPPASPEAQKPAPAQQPRFRLQKFLASLTR